MPDAVVRWVFGILGTLMAAGIVGVIVMYGQLEGALITITQQEQHIDFLDRRMQRCENIINGRPEFSPMARK